jgi:hypothetical protein
MKEVLHHLLDGEVSDGEAAELLRVLAEDGEERSLFRQQMRLHDELARNGCQDTMTSAESAEMMDRLTQAIGIAEKPVAPQAGRFTRGALALIGAACLVVGGGIGYLTGNHDTGPTEIAAPPAVYQPPAPTPATPPLDRDSLVTALRDSIAQAMELEKPASSATPKKRVEHSSRRATSSFDDPTGARAARDMMKHKAGRAKTK